MKELERKKAFIAAVVLAGALTSVAIPAMADTPSPPPTTHARSEPTSPEVVKNSKVLDALAERGVEGDVVTVQEDDSSAFYSNGSNWVLDLNSTPSKVEAAKDSDPSTAASATAAGFSAGICAGKFRDITKEVGEVVFGAQSSCVASNNSFYRHRVTALLRDTCTDPFPLCIIVTDRGTVTSPSSSNFSRLATAAGERKCKTSGKRKYEQRVTVEVRSVQHGPFWQTNRVVACNIG